MKRTTDSELLSNKVFSIINWIDFSFNQKFYYKKTELTNDYIFLYATFLFYVVGNEKYSLDDAVKVYLQNILSKVLNELPQYNERLSVLRIQKHLLFGNKTDLRYLLISQILYMLELLGFSAKEDFKAFLQEKLLFKEKKIIKILNRIINPSLITDKKIVQSFSEYLDFKKSLDSYKSLRIANIGVCATMSAGKSSFVNALLGYDYLPVRNEATTARITSVYDNDHSQKLIGFTMNDSKLTNIENNLSEKDVDSWNSNSDITRIFLQGDLDNIGNNGIVVAVHDTPGTNNSGDNTHHRITVDFLSTHKMDAIVFVVNAEHRCATDEKALLKELYEKAVSVQNIPVIFVLNKADSIDKEKESIDTAINQYKEYIAEIGFTNAKVLPVSAKAARLLKMALKGKGDRFTESECDDFPSIVKKFTKRLVLDNSSASYNNNSKVVVDGESYESSLLQTALVHTGIGKIEKEIEMIVR